MASPVQLGFDAWLEWLGTPRDSVLERFRSREESSFERAASHLFEPPSENSRTVSGLREASATQLMNELADKVGIRPKPFWPSQAPYAICITHDMDRILSTVHRLRREELSVSTLLSTLRDIATASLRSRWEENPFFNFARIEQFYSVRKIPGTLYVLCERRRWMKAFKNLEVQHVIGVYDAKEIVERLSEWERKGIEIGLHGSFDSWWNPSALHSELSFLKNSGLSQIRGIRNHYLNFDLEKTPIHFEDAGLLYDSTMGFNYLNGFRSGACHPYRWNGITEVPFQLMDSALRYETTTHAERIRIAEEIFEEVRGWGGVFVVNWHFHTMNADLFPEWIDLLDAFITRGKTDGAWFTTPRELVLSWRARGGGE